jgi:hypothetical protein
MIEVIILLLPGANSDIVASDLAKEGIIIEHKLDAIGSITGWVEPRNIGKLKTVGGVADVSAVAPVHTQTNPEGRE